MSNYFERQNMPSALPKPPAIDGEEGNILLGVRLQPGQALLPSEEKLSWLQERIERLLPHVKRLRRELRLTQEQRDTLAAQNTQLTDIAADHTRLAMQLRNLRSFLAAHYPAELEIAVIDNRPLLELVQSILMREKIDKRTEAD